ncbi:MAG: hypothetical protein NVS2B3_08090 [Vulcanimicrobiaceae bacterium]
MAAYLMGAHLDRIDDIAAVHDRLRESRVAPSAAQVATINFVVFIDDATHREWVLERLERVARAHPSRSIVLDSTGVTSGIDIYSHVRQHGGAAIVDERVDVGVSTLGYEAILSLVQELAVPDIPTVLWWTGSKLLESRTFAGLAEMAVTVLLDSSGRARNEETLRDVCAIAERYPRAALHDLAFKRLSPWQDIIARFFDDPALREDLFSIVGLEIESGSEAEAVYLAGWLGSRLSWEVAAHDAFTDRRGASVSFATLAGGDRRRVRSVVLRTRESTYRAELSTDDEAVVCLSITGAHARRMDCVPLHDIENTTLIEHTIVENAHDRIFETSLDTVRALLRPLRA